MDRLSSWLDEHWQAVRNVNAAVIVGTAAYLVHVTLDKRQIRSVQRSLRTADFQKRKRLPVRVHGFERIQSKVYARVSHIPPFTPSYWVKDCPLWCRLYGIGSDGLDGPILENSVYQALMNTAKPQVELLFIEDPSGNPRDDSIVGNLLYRDLQKSLINRLKHGTMQNLAIDLARSKKVDVLEIDPPGKHCADDVESLRSLSQLQEELWKNVPKDESESKHDPTNSIYVKARKFDSLLPRSLKKLFSKR